jgi:hypothetical protein
VKTELRRFSTVEGLKTGFQVIAPAFIFFSLLLSSAWASSKLAITNEAEVRVTIDLADGSRLVGRLEPDTLALKSALLGEFKLAVDRIRSIQWKPNQPGARLLAANGDEVSVELVASELCVKTDFGQVRVPVASLRQVLVSASGGPADLKRGLVALWSAEDNARDCVEGHNGEMLYGASFGPGKVGRAFSFSADRGRVFIPDAEDFAFDGSFTVSGWVLVREFPEAGGAGCICQRGDDQRPGSYSWSIATHPGSRIDFSVGDHVSAVAEAGQWHHVACVFDSDSRRLALYMNGQLASEKKTDAKPLRRLNGSFNAGIGLGNVPVKVHLFPFRGLLDEWTIHGRALSELEIRALMDLGNAGQRLFPKP